MIVSGLHNYTTTTKKIKHKEIRAPCVPLESDIKLLLLLSNQNTNQAANKICCEETVEDFISQNKLVVLAASFCHRVRERSSWEQSFSSVKHHSVLFRPLSGAESSRPPTAERWLWWECADNWPSIHFSHWAKRRRVAQPATCGALWSALSSNKS